MKQWKWEKMKQFCEMHINFNIFTGKHNLPLKRLSDWYHYEISPLIHIKKVL